MSPYPLFGLGSICMHNYELTH